MISSIPLRKKINIKFLLKSTMSILLATNPARKPVMVFEIPATPKTPAENESCIIPQTIPSIAPDVSPFSMAKYMTTRLKILNIKTVEKDMLSSRVYIITARISPMEILVMSRMFI